MLGKSINTMVVKVKICILRVQVCVCEWLFPQMQKIFIFFPALKPLKTTKATAPLLPLLQGASFSYCFSLGAALWSHHYYHN